MEFDTQKLRDEIHEKYAPSIDIDNWRCEWLQVQGNVIDFNFVQRSDKNFSTLKLTCDVKSDFGIKS